MAVIFARANRVKIGRKNITFFSSSFNFVIFGQTAHGGGDLFDFFTISVTRGVSVTRVHFTFIPRHVSSRAPNKCLGAAPRQSDGDNNARTSSFSASDFKCSCPFSIAPGANRVPGRGNELPT